MGVELVGPTGAPLLPAGAATEATLLTRATEATLAAVLAKLIAAPATEATSAAILAKIIAAPATEATSAAILAKIIAAPATEATVAAILAKLIAAPATEATLAAVLAKIIAAPATEATSAAILAKLIAAPATEASLAALLAKLGNPPTLFAFVQGAAAAAATCTLPAVAGQFHYITWLRIARVATAALAGTALLTVTTTNLAARGWRVGNAMIAGGTDNLIEQSFPNPIKSAVANTASTIVGPNPGAAVAWDITCDYYTAA